MGWRAKGRQVEEEGEREGGEEAQTGPGST